jgi:DNA-binding transcriptional ArsR family regulator
MTPLENTSASAQTATSEPRLSEAPIRSEQSSKEVFKAALPRGSHPRDFAVYTIVTYIRSEGLCGFDPSSFGALNDIPDSIAKGVIPSITHSLAEAGILVRGAMPFDTHLGLLPTPAFLQAVLNDRSILHHLPPLEAKYLGLLTPSIADSQPETIEKRWLVRLATAFLYVPPQASLSTAHLAKLLPEFEGRDKRTSDILRALHEKELITLARHEGGSELFLGPDLIDRLEDSALSAKLLNPSRKPDPFPFVAQHTKEVEEHSRARLQSQSQPQSGPTNQKAPAPSSARPKNAIAASITTIPETGGNSGREARAAILTILEQTPRISTTDLFKRLASLQLTEPALRYHIKLLSQDGFLSSEGRGRNAIIVRVAKS